MRRALVLGALILVLAVVVLVTTGGDDGELTAMAVAQEATAGGFRIDDVRSTPTPSRLPAPGAASSATATTTGSDVVIAVYETDEAARAAGRTMVMASNVSGWVLASCGPILVRFDAHDDGQAGQDLLARHHDDLLEVLEPRFGPCGATRPAAIAASLPSSPRRERRSGRLGSPGPGARPGRRPPSDPVPSGSTGATMEHNAVRRDPRPVSPNGRQEPGWSSSRWTASGENAGRQTAMYSAPPEAGLL